MNRNDEQIAMNERFNETLKRIANELNHLENEFYVNLALDVGTERIYPALSNAANAEKLIEFNGDEWVAIEKEE